MENLSVENLLKYIDSKNYFVDFSKDSKKWNLCSCIDNFIIFYVHKNISIR